MTKYMGGHGNSLGGVIVDGGQFPWDKYPEKFHMLTEPEESYHGVVYTEALGPAAYIGRVRTVPLRNMGSALSPMNAFQILQGLATLPLRMERHCDNALAVAKHLQDHPRVAWVNFAGLPDSPYFELAQRYTNGKPRRQVAGSAPGIDDASAVVRGRARIRRRHAGHDPPVHRNRAHRRHSRRHRPGACSGKPLISNARGAETLASGAIARRGGKLGEYFGARCGL